MPDGIAPRPPLLRAEAVCGGYGALRVLHDVSIEVRAAEIVALIGPNGAGKSTLLAALSGLIPVTAGRVLLDGQDLRGMTTRRRMQVGLVHVLEGHRVIPSLTVEENLQLPVMRTEAAIRCERIDEAFATFPELGGKRHQPASSLSGGQQQMLAMGQGLVRRPRLLLLDEPSAGLAPVLIDRVLRVLETLAARNTAVLLVEQAVEKALSVATRVYALGHGRIVLESDTESALRSGVIEDTYLGVKKRHPAVTEGLPRAGEESNS